jgi:hypothetical protein
MLATYPRRPSSTGKAGSSGSPTLDKARPMVNMEDANP